MTYRPATTAFSRIFDSAVSACAEAQIRSSRSAETVLRARVARYSVRRVHTLATGTRHVWEDARESFEIMRSEVELVARTLREAGIDSGSASAIVRAHIRFVLYDDGLAERDAEPVVQRASSWVDLFFAAA